MSEVMTVDQAIEFAREWQKGITVYPGATGWRIVCMVLADEIERLRESTEMFDSTTKHQDSLLVTMKAECDELQASMAELEAICENVPEGCTPTDALVLREANHKLAAEVEQIRIDAMRTEQENSLLIAALKKEQDSVDGLNGRIVRIEQERDELRLREAELEAVQTNLLSTIAALKGEIDEYANQIEAGE